jgi:hypothetical protein
MFDRGVGGGQPSSLGPMVDLLRLPLALIDFPDHKLKVLGAGEYPLPVPQPLNSRQIALVVDSRRNDLHSIPNIYFDVIREIRIVDHCGTGGYRALETYHIV